MKKTISILAVAVMTLSVFSCDKNSAGNDDIYENVDTSSNDDNNTNSTGGSGGQ